MPALKMKTKSSMICSIQGSGLGVCKSSKISKNSCCKVSQQTEGSYSCNRNDEDFSSNIDLTVLNNECHHAVDHQEAVDGQTHQSTLEAVNSLSDTVVRIEVSQSQSPTLATVDSRSDEMESLPHPSTSDLETIFSPIFESLEVHGKQDFYNYSVGNDGPILAHVRTDDFGDRSSTSCDYQTCNISDFHISDMTVAGLPFDGSTGFDDSIEPNPFSDHDMMFDITERYMILPFLEESADCGNVHDGESFEAASMSSDDACLYLAIQQMNSFNQETEVDSHSFDPDEVDVSDSDSQMYIRNLADLSDVVPNFWPAFPKEARKRKSITLVLDLDETLVHSSLDHTDDADFTFPVFFNMKEHTVYVRRRPYLQTFLERVAEMFELTIFTASQSNYAEKLLNILDPEGKFISRRAYRDSCIFSEGSYTKDLTVLGLDLAKVAIIDNSPQVFRLQVNNGIPIKSWFDDSSDRALISLLPFLETLVDADDVRPIIQKRFSNKE